MKKIPTLFEREFENHRIVRILPNISPDLAWVMAGEGVATIKWDGACCAVINGVFYKRYDAKNGKPIPPNAIKCQENADPVTGHLPCWMPCDRSVPSDKWFWNAYDRMDSVPDGTYEAIGPHFRAKSYGLTPEEAAVQFFKYCADPKTQDHAIKLLKRWKVEQEVQERNSANAK